MTKFIISLLTFIIFLLQFQLWLGESSIIRMINLNKIYSKQYKINTKLEQENHELYLDFINLKNSNLLIEEIARKDLGYIRQDEIFYQIN
tara:strand:+ start:829 stop:1098 length:270 start_codon:yes stop_codon:yes gene_type:complete